jgi:peroxiredoxin
MLRYDQRQEGSLKVGDKAPDGVLKELQDGKSVSLQENIGDRPLVLIFGSYT